MAEEEPLILPPEKPHYGVGENPRSLANLRPPWQPGQVTNPNGNPNNSGNRKARPLIEALFNLALTDGRVDKVVDQYFDLMLNTKDPRLRFDVMRDFFDRVGMPRVTDNPKMAAQIVNVVRSNSPDLNL